MNKQFKYFCCITLLLSIYNPIHAELLGHIKYTEEEKVVAHKLEEITFVRLNNGTKIQKLGDNAMGSDKKL